MTYSVAGSLLASMPDGLYLSVTCTEDVARIGPNAAAVQIGFLGDFRLRQQVAACTRWPTGDLPEGFYDPVESAVPVLIISGERDPVTPARWGYEVQEFLPNSVHLVVDDGGHDWFGLREVECAKTLGSRLLETGSVAGLDVDGCRAAIERPSFLLEVPRDEKIEMTREALERFVGAYAVEGGFAVTLEVTDEGLVADLGEETLLMVPLAALRFKAAGEAPGNYFDFIEEAGQIRALEMVQGGEILVRLVKR